MKGLEQEINVEEIMEEIRSKIQENTEEERNPDILFNQEIDVAGIMQGIRCDVSNVRTPERSVPLDMDAVWHQLNEIYGEMTRINHFVENKHLAVQAKVDPANVLPVRQNCPRLIQNLIRLVKRLVRKMTRFLTLNQKDYNEEVSACIKALYESQVNVLDLTRQMFSLCTNQMQMQSDTCALSETQTEILEQTGFLSERQRDLDERTENLSERQNDLDERTGQLAERQNNLDQRTEQLSEKQIDLVEKTEQLSEKQGELDESVRKLADLNQKLWQEIETLSRQSDMFSASVAKTILEYRQEQGLPIEAAQPQKPDVHASSEDGNTYTALDYFKFQNHFRGTRALIAERQKMYIPYFKGSKLPVLDLGCGRGEFLGLMKANKIPAFGVDLYPEYVVEGSLNGLDVRQGDGIEFLQNTDQQFGGIFVAQLIEHISFAQIQTLCTSAFEKLVSGGCLILETPNPRCLSIYANAFYIDPTHNKPVHPLTVEYLLRELGFDVKIEFTECTRQESLPLIQSDAIKNLEQVNSGIERVSNLLFGSEDYAIIAQKP